MGVAVRLGKPGPIIPTSLDGLKRLAKAIGKEQNISHCQALEVASKQAGYGCYADARKKIIAKVHNGN